MAPLSAWLAAVRPTTLGLSISPVLAGTALAVGDTGRFHLPVFGAALAAALLIQIGTNLHNDVADHRRGTDRPGRAGPPRAVAEGWLSAAAVERGAWAAFFAAFLIGVYLAWVGGWPIVALGLASLAAGAAYSGGPRPLSSLPVGELFVLLFFGLAAVAGSYYLQTGAVTPRALLAGAALGSPAAAVLVVNNLRDREEDARSGRATLAVLLPVWGSRLEYTLLTLVPFLLLVPLLPFPWLGLPLAALPVALALVRALWRLPPGRAFNGLLARTARLDLLLGLLFSSAAVAPRML